MLSANHGRKRAARRVHDSVELKSGACQNGNLIAAGHVKVDKFKIDKFDRENRCFVLNAPPAMSGTRGCPLSAPKRHCISMRSRPKIGTAGAFLESNTCVIDQKYFFVLGCLEIPVDGENESFSWGVWVSLRKDRFAEFVACFDRPKRSHVGAFFGSLAAELPLYPSTENLKTRVHLSVCPKSS